MPKRPPIRQVYFVEATGLGLVKIGVATRAAHRVRNLQIGSPARLALRGVIYSDDPHRLERGYHRTWAHLRQHGEWFSVDDDLRAFVADALWPADDPMPGATIIFRSPPKRGAFVVEITSWARTAEEVADIVVRAASRHPPLQRNSEPAPGA